MAKIYRIQCIALCLLSALTFDFASSSELLPDLCDAVKCPPLSDIQCPEDSDIRELFNTDNTLLQGSSAANAPTTIDAMKQNGADELHNYNTSNIPEELYTYCCISKKCVCRTCYIPDCDNAHEVVVELQPEDMDTPGQCCGKYECAPEPNCTEVHDTEQFWLRDCQRCNCYSNKRICHQTCDESIAKKPTAICNSKNLNTFFQHGDSWKDGCYECECVNGEEKCVMPFCRSVSCPTHRQVILKDSCCPICWPKGIPMPNIDDDYNGGYDDADKREQDNAGDEDDNTGDEVESGNPSNYDDETLPPLNEIEPLPTLKPQQRDNSTTTNANANATAMQPANIAGDVSTSVPPCQEHSEIVEVVRQSPRYEIIFLVIIIVALIAVIVALLRYVKQLRAKQRSYHPVSNIDDNFNKTTTNIKKMNDYA